MALALYAGTSSAVSISAKLKSKKLLGDLVPAYACSPGDADPFECHESLLVKGCTNNPQLSCAGDTDCGGPGLCSGPVPSKSLQNGHDCSFTKGAFKILAGKEVQIQVQGMNCNAGSPVPTGVCANIATYATIANENIDSHGNPTPVVCTAAIVGDIAGTSNYAIAQMDTIPCDATTAKCQGSIPLSTTDPCPSVDKIAQVARVEVFDGPDSAVQNVIGTNLFACCSPYAEAAGGSAVSHAVPPPNGCQGSVQDVLAVAGTVTNVGCVAAGDLCNLSTDCCSDSCTGGSCD